MQELFKALSGIPKPREKKHFVNVEGKQFEVSLKRKLEMQRVGEQNYLAKTTKFGTEFILKPKLSQRGYKVLTRASVGYDFYHNDPYYPKDHVSGGWQWLHEQE
jgi:hypothetical protein